MAVHAHLPGYRRPHALHSAAVRTGVYVGAALSLVFATWVIVANRFATLEIFALQRNLAAAVALAFLAAIPVVRFIRAPRNLLASSLIAWAMLTATYSLLCVHFWALSDRYSVSQVFMLGVVIYLIVATLAWIGTCIFRARASHASHSSHRHVS